MKKLKFVFTFFVIFLLGCEKDNEFSLKEGYWGGMVYFNHSADYCGISFEISNNKILNPSIFTSDGMQYDWLECEFTEKDIINNKFSVVLCSESFSGVFVSNTTGTFTWQGKTGEMSHN